MKKFIIALVAMFMMTFTSASAMSYEQARQQALFLTDKMAYELNLTDDQYEAAYEVNLDYLMGVDTYDDLYGIYWRQRNLDLSYILLDWQYRSFCAASYFYRPLYWDGGYFHFGIYARYPRRDYFFFGRPHFYAVYRGGHSWRMNGGRSWYHGREFGGPRPIGVRGQEPRFGMRDGFNRGDYGRGKTFGNLNRQSSTRTTVTRDHSFDNSRQNNATFGSGVRGGGSFGGYNRSGFGSGSTNNSRSFNNGFTPRSSTPSRGSFGGNRGGNSLNNSRSFNSGSRSFGGGSNGARSSFGGGSSRSKSNNGGGSFGGRR
ncbi:hypothetical protein [Segatella copri]|uniref:hypothetical protein n=1 Tax=Segatella copri TaxID=165179 RepID=UPI001F272D2D|nr:hypothetical protein [Segatella copri]